jgi:hypothetical protein
MIVSLTGGLGNQLFQMYAGLYFSEDTVTLSTEFGNPRESGGFTDLFHFQLPSRIRIIERKGADPFAEKFGGLAIRRNLIPQAVDKFALSNNLLSSILNSYFSKKLSERVRVFSSPEVGMVDSVPDNDELIFGYFQTYRYFSSLGAQDRQLSLLRKSREFLKLEETARVNNPIVVHVRLGDYAKERHFGVLSANYYLNCFTKLDLINLEQPIWVFSDEPRKALDILPKLSPERFFVVPNEVLTPAETLELMRHGSTYVIANSTFSWWGATLSYSDNPTVIAPEKWFAGMQDPRELLPSKWMTEKR